MKKIIFLIILISFSLKSHSFQKSDSLTNNHKEITFESSSFLTNNNNNSYSASFSYLYKLNKRFELGPQLHVAAYNIDGLGKFYPLSLRGHVKFYFGDLLKMKKKFINQLYATSKVGLTYELKDSSFKNYDQYLLGFGSTVFLLKNKNTLNFEMGASEVSFNRNSSTVFLNTFTFGVNYKF